MNAEIIANELYSRYPKLPPYKGSKYIPGNKYSILLVGESHYYPPNDTSPQMESDIAWYTGDASTLTALCEVYTNTSGIIEESLPKKFPYKSHSIYRNSFWEINHKGPQFEDWREIGCFLAFQNYFQRPATTGRSIQATQLDKDVAQLILERTLKELKPALLVFISRLAWSSCNVGRLMEINSELKIVVTPHPGCAWWNRYSKKFNNHRGRDILGNAVKELDWSDVRLS